MRSRVVLAIGAMALVVAACGDDDDADVSDEERPYVDALVASAAEDDDDEFQLSTEQAECLAPLWVGIIGVDRLQEAGIGPEEFADDGVESEELDLSEEDGGAMVDALGDCDVDVREIFFESMTEDASMSDEDRECLEENFDDDLLRRILVTQFVRGDEGLDEDEELQGDLFAVFAECPGAAG